MISWLRGLIGNRKVVPLALENFSVRLPTEDADDMLVLIPQPQNIENISGIGCVINYVDAKNESSERRITCRKLSRNGPDMYLQAYCHEREAIRTFRVDRIVEVSCGSTGEIFSDPNEFFCKYSSDKSDGSEVSFGIKFTLAADLRASLNVLAFLARADGNFSDLESTIVAEFCEIFAVKFATEKFIRSGALAYARKLAPDSETFFVALDRLRRDDAPRGLAKLVAGASSRLIQVDGVFDDREVHFGEKVLDYLVAR